MNFAGALAPEELQRERARFLSGYPARVQPTGPVEWLGSAGGLSGSLFWRYPAGRQLHAARIWPHEGPDEARLTKLHAWLEAAARVELLPRIERDLQGRTYHRDGKGRLWELMTWLSGEPAGQGPPSHVRLKAAMSALAAVHEALGREVVRGASPGLRRRHGELLALLGGGFDRLEAAVRAGGDEVSQTLARRHLALARRRAPEVERRLRPALAVEVALQPCLRDVRPQHFLFEGDRVSGLVDFGAMDVDTVAGDLARVLSEWGLHGPGPRAVALEGYAEVRGLDPAELSLVGPFEASGAVLGGCRWVQWRFVEGRAFTGEAVVDGLHKAVAAIERLE